MPQSLDLRTLCHALGFTVVVSHGHGMIRRKGEATRRALKFSALIEEFCLLQLGGSEAGPTQDGDDRFVFATQMAQTIVRIMREKGECCAEDLIDRASAEINENWATAKALAHVKLNISDA